MAKGDVIRVRMKDGSFREVTASQAGRKVGYEWEQDGKIQWCVVAEATRGGTIVAEIRCAADQIMVIEREMKVVE